MSTQAQNPVGLSADDIAAAIKKAGIGQQAAPQQQPQLSQADLDKLMNRFNPDETLLIRLFDSGDRKTQLAALNDLVRGVVRESTTVANHSLQYHTQQLKGEFAPALQEVSNIQRDRLYDKFYKANPALKGHDKIVKTVMQGLAQSSPNVETEEELFKLLADATASTIKEIDPKFTLDAQTSPASNPGSSDNMFERVNQPTNVNPTPVTLASGGQSGGVGGGNQSTGDSIFDP